jgi:hypothetical protein
MASTHDYDETSVCSDELSLSLKIDNTSSYGGIISNFNEDQSLTDYSANKSNKKLKKNKVETCPITFEWEKEEKEIVYLTGSFCSWKQFFIMPKTNNKYILTLPLPRGYYKYKFRINDIFYINKNYPTTQDGDNICNYADTSIDQQTPVKNNLKKKFSENTDESDNEKISEKSSENSYSKSNSFEDLEDEDEIICRKRRKKTKKMKKIKYSQIYPKRINLNNYAPDIPYSYNYIYNIDVISKQRDIGKIKYYEPKENNILGDNCSYKKIGVLPAVEINHIHSNDTIISGQRVLCTSFTRYRNKFITFLYYKPI